MRVLTRSWLLRLALLAASAATPGCLAQLGGGDATSSKLGQGDELVTGNASYDEFFASTRNVLSRASSIASPALHKPVAKALEPKQAADEEATIAAVKERADKLKASGSAVYPVLHPEPKVVSVLEAQDKPAAAWLGGVESSLREGVSRARQFEALSREIAALERTRETLEAGVGTSFEDPAVKADVDTELAAARELLAEARVRADAETGRALRFVLALAGAVDTGAAEKLASTEAAKPQGAAAKPGRGGKPGGGGRPAGGGAPAKPAKPKKPAEDFDP